MGLAATPADQQALWNLTHAANYNDDGEAGCTFGCHVSMHKSAKGQPLPSNEDLAHGASPPITLRIDSARTAVQDILNIGQQSLSAKNLKIALYTMQLNPSTGGNLVKVSPPSGNFSRLNTLLSAIDLGSNTTAGVADSDMTDALAELAQVLPANGTGMSSTSPLNYVLIVTDGLLDTPSSKCLYGHCIAALPSSACVPLQAKASVGVVYTSYLPIYNNNIPAQGYDWTYTALVEPVASQLAPNLTACASSSKQFFEASDGPSLIAAMKTIFTNTLSADHLTN